MGAPHSPDVEAGQHGRGAPAEHPHREEDDEQGGAEHHLPGVRGRVTDGQGEGHGSSQPCGKGQQRSCVSPSTGHPHGQLPIRDLHPAAPLLGHPPPRENSDDFITPLSEPRRQTVFLPYAMHSKQDRRSSFLHLKPLGPFLPSLPSRHCP